MTSRTGLLLVLFWVGGWPFGAIGAEAHELPALWTLAKEQAGTHRFSTLFTAHDVRRYLGTDAGLNAALAWCRRTAVTKAYVESFRDGYQADRATIERARDGLRAAGIEVSGCVTTTGVGKKSNRWNIIACCTDTATQDRLGEILRFTGGLFDEIMIDDFWFTDCSCNECDAARLARRVTVGGRTTEPAGDTWEDYRRELMLRLSAERLIGAAREANPRCQLIVKYPQWYDVFHERGYDVAEQTRLFDRIWVGTETRDYDDRQWGGTVQYEAFFILRWLGGLGGAKCGGGWFDWLGTTERTYVEQARQTILGGARESLLFCYGGLQGTTGPANVDALRSEIPGLFNVAREVGRRQMIGVAAYKPPNSPAGAEKRVFDFVGMLGIPLAPCHEFPTNAPAAFFSTHALKDPDFTEKLKAYLPCNRPVLLTDGLAKALPPEWWRNRPGVRVLSVNGDPKSLLRFEQEALDELRAPLLSAFGAVLSAPNRVALCLFDDESAVIQNFNDTPVTVAWDRRDVTVPARGWWMDWK